MELDDVLQRHTHRQQNAYASVPYVCIRECMLPRGRVRRSRREATLCGLHVTGKPFAVRSRWGASVHAAAAGSK